MNDWLPKGAPAGVQQSRLRTQPATLALPFVATVSYSKEFPLDPYTLQFEQGRRYYLALYGLVLPFWTSVSQKGVLDVEGP